MAKILVIEDSDDTLEMITVVLQTYGHEVAGTSIKDKILSIISQFNPQLVLLDLWFGHKFDKDICKHIKSVHKNLPVILMSEDAGLLPHYKENCGDDFIEKPFDILELKNKIDDLLQ